LPPLHSGERVHALFLCTHKALQRTPNGRHLLVATLPSDEVAALISSPQAPWPGVRPPTRSPADHIYLAVQRDDHSVHVARVIAVLEPGGAQLSALRLSEELSRRGIKTQVFVGHATAAGRQLYESSGIRVTAFDGGPGLQYEPCPRFAAWLAPRLATADLVHGHMFGGWWAAARAAPPGVPVVASEHNTLRWPSEPEFGAMTEALAGVDRFFAHGQAARELVEGLGFPRDRLRAGISAIDSAGAPVPGLPLPRLIFAGRLHDEKGPDLLLEALAQMRRPPATLFLGAGPIGSALAARAAELGLSGVRFLGWQPRPAGFLAGAAACVVPSRHESWSQTATMAMALGVPVIATAVEGLPTTLARGRGVLVPPEDAQALADAISGVLDGRIRPNLGRARAYAARFTVAPVADVYEREYRELVARTEPAVGKLAA
jgi:glycosyltransferase involved in cell wall biosynthesis